MPELYQRVLLNRDFPEYNLKKGDIATLVDTVPHPAGGEEGYILEIFNDLGESINTVVVPCSTVEDLNDKEVFNEEGNSQIDELQQVIKWGIDWENIVKKYQILVLPQNIENYSDDINSPTYSELIDTDDAIHLSKLLREAQVKCATSYDLGIKAKVSSNRSIEIRLGVIWILNHACLPILIGLVSRIIGDKVTEAIKQNKADTELPTIKASIKVLEGKISSASIEYNGDAQEFIRMLEGIQNDKQQ
ncbi:DUF4926 domain-containing protein [Dolichospermum heterosporum]|uniref:DUF4926 domain-containing protein n=1 Tax=Dolichospermum heterosporum TAC447 TaxID=747523 RepID=A0ABY5LZE8_9CYAN|nr:DUF4926 domain-containing protein [Dolichospermum heterosporum]UUO16369.1 DUF4926 domain-containing protein [Dolichospermum heterosporum TAC447]